MTSFFFTAAVRVAASCSSSTERDISAWKRRFSVSTPATPAASSSAAIGPFIDSAVDKCFCCPANSAQRTEYFNNNNNSKHNVDLR